MPQVQHSHYTYYIIVFDTTCTTFTLSVDTTYHQHTFIELPYSNSQHSLNICQSTDFMLPPP